MNCMEFRRLMLAEPRSRSEEQQAHLAQCEACAGFMKEIESLEARIEEAMLVPVPESLDERVLLRRKIRAPAMRTWALAASLVAALGVGIYFYRSPGGVEDRIQAATSLGTYHLAVKAIVHVLDDEPQMLKDNPGFDPAVMQAAFTRLGFNARAKAVTVRYFGPCPMMRDMAEHVVLQTPFGQATLILVPDQPLASRVVVTDRDKTAVVGPARAGGYYILVADSPTKATQVEKMLIAS